jgi:hypothetical protein
VDSRPTAFGERLEITAVQAHPSAMRRLKLLVIPLALSACSSGSDKSQQSTANRDALEANEPAAIRSARQMCAHLRETPREHEDFDVGISDYQACLGKKANLTHPANAQLCDLAKSTMSASGVCVLAE